MGVVLMTDSLTLPAREGDGPIATLDGHPDSTQHGDYLGTVPALPTGQQDSGRI
jgi:hypothetical protein